MANSIDYKVSVSVTGTEKEFMTKLINTITGLSTAITCTGSVDQYDSGDTSTVPTFTFAFNGKDMLTLTRAAAISSAANIFNVDIFVDDYAISTNQEIVFCNSSQLPSAEVNRIIDLSWIVSDNLILLCLMANIEHYGYKHHTILNIKSGDVVYGDGWYKNNSPQESRNAIFNIYQKPLSGTQYFVLRDFDSDSTGSFTSRFACTSMPGQIDYVKSAVYTNGGYKVFDITSVYDCTTLNVGDTVALKDGAYLAVGPNQLVKVS